MPSSHSSVEDLNHDWQLLDRYQAFSAEVLRLSLLGTGGVGFLILNLAPATHAPLTMQTRVGVTITLIVLGLAAATALLHRYISVDSMARHLSYLRKRAQARPDDRGEADRLVRNRQFKRSASLLFWAAALLAAGAGLLTWTLGRVLYGA